jgi:hypothetical protein
MITMRIFQTLERADVAMMVKKEKEIEAVGCQGKANHPSGYEAGDGTSASSKTRPGSEGNRAVHFLAGVRPGAAAGVRLHLNP